MFGGVALVAITAHKSLNVPKGVVRNWELGRTDPDEIKETIQNILDVQRIVVKRNNVEVKRNNVEVKTNTLVSTLILPRFLNP